MTMKNPPTKAKTTVTTSQPARCNYIVFVAPNKHKQKGGKLPVGKCSFFGRLSFVQQRKMDKAKPDAAKEKNVPSAKADSQNERKRLLHKKRSGEMVLPGDDNC